MRRRLLIALFAAGTLVGFGSGFAHLWCRHAHAHRAWHACAQKKAPPAEKH